jgi:hypothetical protein
MNPKFLNHLPKGYQLDRGDKRKIASYRANWKRKQRTENKITNP